MPNNFTSAQAPKESEQAVPSTMATEVTMMVEQRRLT